eukprot:gnl/MRDRNA2_/MRDRNA2_87763_c0_seq1.p1 gnl/MRDRNA2_/MRDRNA2_87763_c0~~gnl/MRDRNA2_/MRDRNA2_87763_c0_seq1.p1  ORF type:complete len:101 (-),score=29.42 gnl/MRDRNA2_/MRDRNA2_87763_c0_seq1:108-410(-)
MARIMLLIALSSLFITTSGTRGLRRFSRMSTKIQDEPKEEPEKESKKDEPWHAGLGKGELADHNVDEEPGRRDADPGNKTIQENVTKAQDPAAHPDFGAR